MARPAPAHLGRIPASFGLRQIERVRRAYTSASEHRSERPGYAGMLEEMQWGLQNLEPARRDEADRRALEAMFIGPRTVKALGRLAGWAPRLTPALMAWGTPIALGWLVGEVRTEGTTNHLPQCSFRAGGGQALCEHVCRRPAEAFCTSRVARVRLDPDPDSMACTWSWGEQS